MNFNKPALANLIYSKLIDATPLISIIIPTYKRFELLADAINSALQQDTDVALEIVIIDNDPSSKAEILGEIDYINSRHQFRYYINDTNLGMFGNWNQGIALARGRWITLLHDDDWLSPNFIESMLPLIRSGADFAVCRVKVGTKNFSRTELNRKFDSNQISNITLDDLIFGSPSPAPGILVKRNTIIDVGGFDPATYPAGDYITYAKCAAAAVRSVRLDKTLAYYRTSDSATFKGNTLQKIISQSIDIKKELLKKSGKSSNATYILSMAYWFRVARLHKIKIKNIDLDWKLILAKSIFRFRATSLSAEILRKLVKRIMADKKMPKIDINT